MSDWQPIDTAPKDGTVIDLWMVDETGKGWREASAYYVTGREDYEAVWDAEHGRYSIKNRRAFNRDGWWAPNHDYDNQDGWCDLPRRFNRHPLVRCVQFKLPTHWMPLPSAPPAKQ